MTPWLALVVTLAVSPAQSPQEIEALQKQVLQHLMENKPAAAIPLLDKALAKYPDSHDVHSLLAGAHEGAAEALEGIAADAERRREHLRAAARHYRRTLELTHVNRASHLHSLAEIHLKSGLNDLAEAERHARRLATDHPTLRSGHGILIRALGEAGRPDDAVAAIAAARKALPPEEHVHVMADALLAVDDMEKSALRVVLAQALRIADAAIATSGTDWRMPMFKATILQMQADHTEVDPQRRAALRAESERLSEKARAMNRARSQPPAPEPPPAPPSPAEQLLRRAVELWDAVRTNPAIPAAEGRKKLEESLRALDDALKLQADYREALVYKSIVLRLQAEKYEPDPQRAKALIEEAERVRARALELMKRR
jgi:tetratricopeptide (TPR) repeat protein